MKIFLIMLLAIGKVLYCPAQALDFATTNFSKADSIAALYEHHSLTDLAMLAQKLTGPLSTEQEKFRVIFKWICNNIEYDQGLYTQNLIKRKRLGGENERLQTWNNKFTQRVVKTLIRSHRTVCSGYASLLRELSAHAGIECITIDGYGRTIQSNIGGKGILNHSWNAVRLNGNWYLCDVTWSSGGYDLQRQEFIKNFQECYFLTEPDLFVRNHFPLDIRHLYTKNDVTLQEFLNRPIFYASAIAQGVKHIFPDHFKPAYGKDENINIGFTCDKKIVRVSLLINGRKYDKDVSKSEHGIHIISHQFENKGKRTVHLLLDDQPVATYEFHIQ